MIACDVGTDQSFARQVGTELIVDGMQVAQQQIAVDELYAGEVMKK